ncbi:MAG TPA: prolipoprotein diacylglyceryl transferase, partial [Candidatus Nanoarchaeia archaeon]|nr:prolipoprotein diacylglyceryl transferase [Candidatus Nanoarchaeia archaeon]
IVNFGPLEIRWYGLVYVLGFLLAVWWLNYLRKNGKTNITKEQSWDLIFYIMVGVIVGARVFMIFWDPQHFLYQPLNLLKIWQGGMSFHGGLVGAILGAYYYCRKHHLNFLTIADLISVPAIFALTLGRIANFINGELIGRPFNGSWCVIFSEYDQVCRHPSTLYAALTRLIIFGGLVFLTFKKQFKPGFIFWNLIFWIGLGRVIVDFFRENSLYLELSLGQWFSLIMVLVALYFFKKYYKEDWKSLVNA